MLPYVSSFILELEDMSANPCTYCLKPKAITLDSVMFPLVQR